MTNAQIAAVFEQMADLLEFKGDNPFRVRAYRNGARAVRDLPESVASIVADDPKRLLEVDGIGKAVAEKCAVLVETGGEAKARVQAGEVLLNGEVETRRGRQLHHLDVVETGGQVAQVFYLDLDQAEPDKQ